MLFHVQVPLFPDNFNENSNLEDINSKYIPSTDYNLNNNISISVDNRYQYLFIIHYMRSPPSMSTCSVSNGTTNRYSAYITLKTINPAVSVSSNNHPKHGIYLLLN